jgi:hypothetical protein
MNHPQNNNGTIAGTLGGTLLSIFASVDVGDVAKTAVLAVVGAVVSFSVSLLLKKITRLIGK